MFGAAAAGVDGRNVGVASGMASTTQQVGAAVGLALLVAVAAGSGASRADGLRHAVLLAALGAGSTALIALRFRRPRAAGTGSAGAAGSARVERPQAEPAGG